MARPGGGPDAVRRLGAGVGANGRASAPVDGGSLEEQLVELTQAGVDGYVYVNTAGHTPHASSFNGQVWAGARRRAGLEGIRWHDLRHTTVALAIEQGAHAKAIQERMGHASVKVTLDRYGHILPSIERRLAGGLDDVYRQSLARHGEGTTVSLREELGVR